MAATCPGCSPHAARRRSAHGVWGTAGVWWEVVADLWRSALPAHLDIVRQDLKYAVRALNQARGFAVTFTLVGALGIGANTAVFSLTDHVLVRDLPFANPASLVRVFERLPQYGQMEPSPANYRDWTNMQSSFAAMGAYRSLSVNLVGDGDPLRLSGMGFTSGVLPMLGVTPQLGRIFTPKDDEPGASATVLISDGLWRSQFDARASILGATLRLNGEAHQVIGVMPATFLFPARDVDVWVPMRFEVGAFDDRDDNFLSVVARLAPGVTVEAARDDMSRVAAQLESQYPNENAETGVALSLMSAGVSSESRLLLFALVGAALCVLLVACTNLANLVLARIISRQPEMAVRQSLGAGRDRLARQLLTESVLLAVVAGVCGVGVGYLALPWLSSLVPTTLPIAEVPSLDGRVLAVSLGLTALTGVGVGLWPAWRAGRGRSLAALKDGARAGSGPGRERFRSVLAVIEVAASVTLLVVCALLLQTFWQLQAVDPGFRPDGVVTMRTWLPLPKYEQTDRREQFFQRVLADVSALPGVTSAGFTSFAPFTMTGGVWPVHVTGLPEDSANDMRASLRVVTPGFFRTLGIPLLSGRVIAETDRAEREPVAVVSQSFVDEYLPGGAPLGKTFDFAFMTRTVVGVAADIRVRGTEPRHVSEPQVYVPHAQMADGSLPFYVPKDLLVRAAVSPIAVSPMSLVPAIRRAIGTADPAQPVSDVVLLSDLVEQETAERSVQIRVIAAFAAVALLLAVVGIYGVLSFGVTQRLHEFGVRLALGATPQDIVMLVTRQTARLAVAGVGVGLIAGYVASRSIESLLVGVTAGDLMAYVVVGLLAGLTALVAGLAPARRAARVGAASVIRQA
ncbi:MAG: ABC transporter permease [Acidobacteria bacterium]|nr:ABC transporter permease [Acidobacteriota bacterium]